MLVIHDGNTLPCPFCGEEAALTFYPASDRINSQDSYYIGCSNEHCGCEIEHTGGFKTAQEAIAQWNRRINDRQRKN